MKTIKIDGLGISRNDGEVILHISDATSEESVAFAAVEAANRELFAAQSRVAALVEKRGIHIPGFDPDCTTRH